ncbi:MAG: M48 family metalloprotease [Terriglobales bacterium]
MAWQMIAASGGVAPLGPAELARARQYLFGGLAWSLASEFWMLALLAAAYFTGITPAWRAWLQRRMRSPWAVAALVTAALFAVILGLLLPFDFYIEYAREKAFGFQHMTAAGWFGQWAISLVLTTVVGVIVASIGYGWMRRPGRPKWWLKLWIVIAVGVVLSVAIDPIVISPLFNKFTPVKNPQVRAAIERLASKAGIPHAEILEMNASAQSAHTNAYVVGVLGSQRIVVYDTLLRDETLPEIEFTVSHEIGHYVLHHLWKGIAFSIGLLLALFALLGWLYPRWSRGHAPADPAGLPLMLLILLGLLFLASPATNGFSRWEEHQADAYGLRLSQKPLAAVHGFQSEEHTDLIYPDPPGWMVWWFFNHPSQQERINFSRAQIPSVR